MIAFRAPVLADRQWVQQQFAVTGNRGCEYSFATLFLWSGVYRQQVARSDGYVLERLQGKIGDVYLFPEGSGPLLPVLRELAQDAAEEGSVCRLVCVTAKQLHLLQQEWPGTLRWEEDRDGFDYLYEIDRLADLPGRKLQAKRNHINRFLDKYPDWHIEEITQDNLPACAAMDCEWNRRYRGRPDTEEKEEEKLFDESLALSQAFAHYGALGLSGILLRVDGEVIAFTMGSPINEDTFDIHFEKAFGEMQGSYPLINREFARWLRERFPHIRYLNREDDLGLPGLRRSKESYYPDLMVEKYTVTLF